MRRSGHYWAPPESQPWQPGDAGGCRSFWIRTNAGSSPCLHFPKPLWSYFNATSLHQGWLQGDDTEAPQVTIPTNHVPGTCQVVYGKKIDLSFRFCTTFTALTVKTSSEVLPRAAPKKEVADVTLPTQAWNPVDYTRAFGFLIYI